MSGNAIELGLVPFGSIGLSLFALDLAFAAQAAAAGANTLGVADFLASPRHWRVAFDLVALGVFGGFFIVPLLALVQNRSEPTTPRIIAANNIVNAAFMVVAALLGACCARASRSRPCSSRSRS
jgi:hypothetical protein